MEAKLNPTTEASDKFVNKIGTAASILLYAIALAAVIFAIRWW
jgi:hypothetical protein